MNILIIGSGGREHALAFKFSKEDRVENVFVYPGNPGMQKTKKVEIFNEYNEEEFLNYIQKLPIEFAIIGPENFIVNGFQDKLKSIGIKTISPSVRASKLESSKVFSKNLMKKYHIPTAAFVEVSTYEQAIVEIDNFPSENMVLKLSGLHAGKGVFLPENKKDAKSKLNEIKQFISEGLLIEEKLVGPEVSLFYLCKNNLGVYLGNASDHKRIFDGNLGPNTGGMGCFSPNQLIDADKLSEIYKEFVIKTLNGLTSEGILFEGILFLGLMLTDSGPKLLEYNVRFGDPETQCILPLINEGFLDLFLKASSSKLDESDLFKLTFHPLKSVHVVKSSKGYPENPILNIPIVFSNEIDPMYFFSGVKSYEGKLLTSGGRVCGLTTLGENFNDTIKSCYEKINQVSFEGEHFRKDIGGQCL
jgi:phosphoribosylamine--glycine ligase